MNFVTYTLSGTIFAVLLSFGSDAVADNLKKPLQIHGVDLVSGLNYEFELGPSPISRRKGYVIVFMSAVCPCSNSHVPEMKKLSQEFKDFQFIAVHSNMNETKALAANYFKGVQLPFPILADSEASFADQLKAYKTPHAYVFDMKGELQYQGGVTSSAMADQADRHFLREALQDMDVGKPVRMSRGRTLGCVISRSKE